jgi:hypothetical protein
MRIDIMAFIRWVLSILVIAMLLSLMSTLIGCSQAKKIETAKQRVRLSPQAFSDIGKEYDILHPCINDTITKHDSTVIATEKIVNKTDTLTKGDTVYIFTYDTAYKTNIVYQTKTITDNKRINVLVDSVNALLRQKAALNQNIIDSHAVYVTENKERKKWLWLFIAACAALVLTNGLWIFSKIKSAPVKTAEQAYNEIKNNLLNKLSGK